MKNIRNKIAALVCGIVMLCGMSIAAYAAYYASLSYNPSTGCGTYSINICGGTASGTLCGAYKDVENKFLAMCTVMEDCLMN